MICPAYRFFSLLLAAGLLAACGGGGGGGSSNATPEAPPAPTPVEEQPIELQVLDSLPGDGATTVNPWNHQFSFAHAGHSDLTITYDSNCPAIVSKVVRRRLFDQSTGDFDQLIDHRLGCTLEAMNSYQVDANGTRPNEAAFKATLSFSTGTDRAPGLVVLDEFALTISDINDLFETYVEESLLAELDLPSGIEALTLAAITDIAEANWDNLVNPQALYPVRSQRVSYLSRNPAGEPDDQLTGLIAFPATNLNDAFESRDRMLVLTHATGSTPGDLNFADAWFILANLFASRGYLVVAADNYGRGGTGDAPETYLMANRTAASSIDLLRQVMADEAYDDIYDGTEVNIVGYSQGGHSALALWLAIESGDYPDLQVAEVYAGGAPYNLYETFRGVVRHLAGECNGQAFCEFVDSETTVPFATDRILPGFLAFTDSSGLSISDVVTDSSIAPDFVTGFLENDPAYDGLKSLLQLSSFTNIETVDELLGNTTGTLHLYHSRFDRLVPVENTEQLVDLLSPHVNVSHHTSRCNGDGYEVIFNLTEKVGAVHALCGLSVLDDAMENLR